MQMIWTKLVPSAKFAYKLLKGRCPKNFARSAIALKIAYDWKNVFYAVKFKDKLHPKNEKREVTKKNCDGSGQPHPRTEQPGGGTSNVSDDKLDFRH